MSLRDPKLHNVRRLLIRASLTAAEAVPSTEQSTMRQAMETARPDLMTDGFPTLQFMEAWLCHEGVNRNRNAFVADDLEAAAAKITATTPIVMDFNHSAVTPFSWDPACIGVWYAAEKAWDPQALDGNGAWGIRAKGVMFAWLYPELADLTLAEQARHGFVNFSMACIAARTELMADAQGIVEVLREPTFFTLSLLDVPPADPDAVGTSTEGGQAPTTANVPLALQSAAAREVNESASLEADPMNDELKMLLANLEERLQAQLSDTIEGLLGAQRSELTAMQTRLDEAELARDSAATQVATLEGQVETLTQELTAAAERLAAFEQAEAERVAAAAEQAQAERLAQRIAALPEAVRKAHAQRDAERRTRLEAKWASMSDEEWEPYVMDELLAGLGNMSTASSHVSYLERSTQEGFLPVTGGSDTTSNDWSTRIARHLK